jgi:pyridoxal biosynthesis lyase PdxS
MGVRMNLIQTKTKLEELDKNRNKILGQKEMAMKSLHDFGFNSITEATRHIKKLETEIDELRSRYEKGCESFTKKYKDLLKQ